MKLQEINIDNLNIEGKENILSLYKYFKDNIKIGYAIITKDEEDKIKIYIDEPYQGNGYGKKLFKDILDIVNNEVVVKTDNPIMKIIINFYGGIEISNKEGNITYKVPRISN